MEAHGEFVEEGRRGSALPTHGSRQRIAARRGDTTNAHLGAAAKPPRPSRPVSLRTHRVDVLIEPSLGEAGIADER